MFTYHMVILSDKLEFECTAYIKYEAHCVTWEELRVSWWPDHSGVNSTLYCHDWASQASLEKHPVEWKPYLWKPLAPWSSVCTKTEMAGRATSSDVFLNERGVEIVRKYKNYPTEGLILSIATEEPCDISSCTLPFSALISAMYH